MNMTNDEQLMNNEHVSTEKAPSIINMDDNI